MRKLIITLILCSMSFFVNTIYAFEFSPIGFDKRIDNGNGYAEFYLDNSTDEIQRYRIKVISTEKTNDISKYINIYPTIVNVNPKDRGILKVYAEAPSDLKDGVYRFMLSIESIAVPSLKKDKKDINGAVSMRVNVNLEMEAYVGEIKDNIKVIERKVVKKNNESYFIGEFLNDSIRGYEIGVGFVDSNNSLIEVHSQGRISKNGKMKVELKIPSRSKKIVFYDYNNQVFLQSSLTI